MLCFVACDWRPELVRDLVQGYEKAKIVEVLDPVVRAQYGSLAQLVRAFASHAKGRWFESSKIHEKATGDGGFFAVLAVGGEARD